MRQVGTGWLRLAILAIYLVLVAGILFNHSRLNPGAEQQVQAALREAGADPRLAPLPPLGYDDWNAFHCNVDQRVIEQTALVMVSSGMRAAGYRYITIDDCWSAMTRTARGELRADSKRFPAGMRSLANHIHSLGFAFGIYADAGTRTCQSRPGSYGHEAQDAATFASWGVDYVKYDACSIPYHVFPGFTHDQAARLLYAKMSAALRSVRRPIVLSMSNGIDPAIHFWTWGAGVAHLWRTTMDLGNTWGSILHVLDQNVRHAALAGPGHWNDPDMLEVGNGRLTPQENQAHFSLWSIMAAPLIAGTDLRRMSPATRHILTNEPVIAVDQDPRGRQGTVVARSGNTEILTRPLVNGDWAAVFLNRGTPPIAITAPAVRLGLASTHLYRVWDLWTQATRFSGRTITVYVPARAAVTLRISACLRASDVLCRKV